MIPTTRPGTGSEANIRPITSHSWTNNVVEARLICGFGTSCPARSHWRCPKLHPRIIYR
ncbi:unnamed protein product, partial [Nesidiocoris tenuis]